MKTVTVHNKEALQRALKSDADEIVIESDELIAHLRVLKNLRKAGPFALGVLIAAIPLMVLPAGRSLTTALKASTATSGSNIAALCVTIGGIVAIGIFTDWEEVEIAGIFKLKRKK